MHQQLAYQAGFAESSFSISTRGSTRPGKAACPCAARQAAERRPLRINQVLEVLADWLGVGQIMMGLDQTPPNRGSSAVRRTCRISKGAQM